MNASSAVTLVGGLGLFLLGIHHLTEGLKGLAGDSLRRALQTLVGGRLSAIVSGAVFTVALQSSTATTLTVIGFVSAGLVTFVAGGRGHRRRDFWHDLDAVAGRALGFSRQRLCLRPADARHRRLSLADRQGPDAIGGRDPRRLRTAVLSGSNICRPEWKGISWNLDAIGGSGFGWQWILAGIGILMSIVMQSSSAAAATTLVALHAGSLTFDQACAMIVGQSVGTAATSAMVAIGAGLAVRRAALAHIVYNVTIGILGIVLLQPLAAAGGWVGSQLDDPHGVLALAAFSSIFKFVGVAAFYPWLDGFSRFIVRISGSGADSAVARLEPTLAEAGGAVALEAAWRAVLEVAHGSVDAVRRRLAGQSVSYDPPLEAVGQIEHFLESLSLETTDLGTFEPRLVRLCPRPRSSHATS